MEGIREACKRTATDLTCYVCLFGLNVCFACVIFFSICIHLLENLSTENGKRYRYTVF